MIEGDENAGPLVLEIPSVKFVARKNRNGKRQFANPVENFENNVEPQSGEKKKQALTAWLNKVLTPPIEVDDPEDDARPRLLDPNEVLATMKTAVNGQLVVPPVPSKEQASLQFYVSRRWMNKLRTQASNIYANLEPMLSRLDEAIDNHKIIVRKEKLIHTDVGLQRFLLEILLSVYPLWLRIGLETVYGAEIDQLKNNKDQYGLTRFLLQRMFNDPDLQAQYGFDTVIHYYKEDYAPEIAKFFIKKVLRLFIFLDRAKTNRLIKYDPYLFYRNSAYKSTRDVLSALTTEILRGDGNLFKLLDQIGCQYGYRQTYVDEARYYVKNLMQDLRDGVILCRVVELLTDDCTLMAKLRCPPISILQKLHNVSVAFGVLKEKGVQLNDILPKKIVEGHSEKTMMLVNRMMLRFFNIKIDNGVAELLETVTRFQAHCKGFLLRRRHRQDQEHQTVTENRGNGNDAIADGDTEAVPKTNYRQTTAAVTIQIQEQTELNRLK